MFIGEIKAYGATRAFEDEYMAGLRVSLGRVLAIMMDFGTVCPLMGLFLLLVDTFMGTDFCLVRLIASQVEQVRDAQEMA